MEETQKLIDEINELTCMLAGKFSDYEAHDIAVKILALQEQRKAEPLTKREQFAGMAFEGLLANAQNTNTALKDIKGAILIADTLIEELNKPNNYDYYRHLS